MTLENTLPASPPELGAQGARNGKEPHEPGLRRFTDMGNAERLVDKFGEEIRYCRATRQWLIWDGTRFAPDSTGRIELMAKATVRAIYGEAEHIENQDQRKDCATWGKRSESVDRIRAMIDLARSEPGVPVAPGELDSDPWLLNTLECTIDLRTGKALPHDPANLITKLAPVIYDPQARYLLWDEFLEDAIPDPDTWSYVQKYAGMSLTGDASEDVIILVHGPGGTGKGTLRAAMMGALGPDYAATTDLSTFTSRRDAHGPQPDLARLAGVRLVTIPEVEATGTVALLKRVTGGDPIQTRSHHQETFEYVPQFTLWLMANDRPRVPDTDTGIWRRMREIPFTTVFSPPDPSIRLCLADPDVAGPAVLAWAVQGCLAWIREGLGSPPPQVAAATAEYRTEMDPLAEFLEDRTTVGGDAWTVFTSLFDAYQDWAEANHESKPLGRKSFSQRLAKRFTKENRRLAGGRGFLGIGLVKRP